MDITDTTGGVQFLPIGGEPLEGCECQGPFHEKDCPGINAERERQREERLAGLFIRCSRSHWLSYDEQQREMFLRGLE